jgi:signal transduction histidine kinase
MLDGLVRLHAAHPELPVVVMTGAEGAAPLEALREGAQDFLLKDQLDPDTLLRAVLFALERQDRRAQELATARREEEARQHLRQSEHLIGLGQLAAGVAHEVNNPLAFVAANLDALLADPDRSDADRTILEDCKVGVQRVAGIVADLQTLARADTSQASWVEPGVVVAAALNLLHSRINRSGVEVTSEVEPSSTIAAHEGRLLQLLANLVTNALHAVRRGMVRKVRVEAGPTPAGGVYFAVEDSGPGMTEDEWARARTPFFTTRAHRGGMGLGLAICADIAHAHSGELRLEPSTLGGARVVLELPADTGLEVRVTTPVTEAAPAPARPRLLIVDDEPLLLRAYQRMLAPRFEVAAVGSGEAALLRLEEPDAPFDMVLCDIEMPGLDGPSLYDLVRERNPDMARRFVFFTGGVFSSSLEALREGDVPVLGKPLDLRRVLQALALVRHG